jgi:biopolymer transport protein ExbD
MAQIESNDGGGKKKKGGSKQKKFSVHVDFTPMVDMNMLLITFFMLCTSLSKPQTMEISMPSNDPNIKEEQQAKVKASQAITVLLSGKDKIYYFTGQPQYNNPQSLTPTSYTAEGLRKFLLTRNLEAAKAVAKLKEEKKDKKISEDTFKKKVAEIKSGKNTPVVIIKATDEANYKNLIDVLDEMQICSVGKYVIDKITQGDKDLIKTYEVANNLPLSNIK